ncbi:hypothetical protein AMTR_s00048p00070730 [Amborella trichopoda]|uniref:Uncharacterized protein n=1 Tax=Amborella trichopoda TaxID=13333 RepID=U5CZV8_AMBTC|nr:hypothetical protein AMTR_s00048p00070730 [Amborella trichopoda]
MMKPHHMPIAGQDAARLSELSGEAARVAVGGLAGEVFGLLKTRGLSRDALGLPEFVGGVTREILGLLETGGGLARTVGEGLGEVGWAG